MKVAVTGGTGFTGPAIVEEMLRAGHEVVLLEHRSRATIAQHSRLHRVRGDVLDLPSLREAFEGVDAVAHLVAIIRGSPSTFERVHVQGTRNVASAAKERGVKRFLLMSANGVDLGVDTPYFATKREMERIVKEAGFDWTIFRPSYIAAGDAGGFDAQFSDVIEKYPALPSFGGGRFEIQPVARKNVAEAFTRALVTPASIGKTYVLAGPERMTWNEYLRRLLRVRARKRPIVPAPVGPVTLAARVLGDRFPADADQIRMLVAGNTGDPSEAVKDLGLELQPWEHAVAALKR